MILILLLAFLALSVWGLVSSIKRKKRQNQTMAVFNRETSKTELKLEEKPLKPFDVIQVNSRGVQLLESLHIIETTKSIETLSSRIDFLLEIYSSLVVLAMFKQRYVTEAEKAMNTYKTRYPDRIITQPQAALLLTPNLDQLKNHISSCVVLSYGAFVKSELFHIEKLTRESAIHNRKESIIRTGYDMKYLFKTYELPNDKHLDAIEEIRKQFYKYQKK